MKLKKILIRMAGGQGFKKIYLKKFIKIINIKFVPFKIIS